jgi:queuine tRNA-ribosyltransferase
MDSEPSPSHEMTFSILGSAAPVLAPRVGTLALAGRQAIATPNLVPLTSRGTVPHISHDMVRKETSINSLYIGLEDCMCDLKCPHFLWLLMPTVPWLILTTRHVFALNSHRKETPSPAI